MFKIGALVSGGGTNLQAIIDSVNDGYIKNGKIVTVVSSKDGAFALERAKNNNIPSSVIKKKDFDTAELYEDALIKHFKDLEVDLIVMAGFMVIIGSKFVKAFPNKIMNVHPSLIPSFCGDGYYGLKVHQAVLKKGVKVTGATVHFVSEITDGGPIILQKSIDIAPNHTDESLQKEVMEKCEWIIYKEAVKLFCENKLVIKNEIVEIVN